MQPSMPSTAASTNIKRSWPPEKVGTCRLGSSALNGGMVLRPASWNRVIDSTVPSTSASSCGGQKRFTLAGVNQRIATVINASASSIG